MPIIPKPKKKRTDVDMELVVFLKGLSLFSTLTKGERINLSRFIYQRQYKKNEIIVKKGYPNVVFYIVQKGELLIYLEHGEEQIELRRVGEKEFFGEIGIFLEEDRTASVKATMDSTLLAIPTTEFQKFIDQYPRAAAKILFNMGQVLANNILRLNNKLQNMKIEK